jgi:hypothetical protein
MPAQEAMGPLVFAEKNTFLKGVLTEGMVALEEVSLLWGRLGPRLLPTSVQEVSFLRLQEVMVKGKNSTVRMVPIVI